jgi:hypothetical protein
MEMTWNLMCPPANPAQAWSFLHQGPGYRQTSSLGQAGQRDLTGSDGLQEKYFFWQIVTILHMWAGKV